MATTLGATNVLTPQGTPPTGSGDSRYWIETHTPDGRMVAVLPYQNIQYEQFLNSSGGSFRCNIPYRGRSDIVNTDTIRPIDPAGGGHEIWLFDRLYSPSSPLWAGPIWDITASSGDGTLSVSAQDPLSYMAKRITLALDLSGVQPADAIVAIVTAMNSNALTNITASKQSSNASTIGSLKYTNNDIPYLADILKALEPMCDGTDYYMRSGNAGHVLMIYGGQKKSAVQTRSLEYGGDLANHSIQYNSQAMANQVLVVGQNGLWETVIGGVAGYNKYVYVDRGSDLTDATSIGNQAITELKALNSILTTPTLVTKNLDPLIDFELGDQFRIIVNDDYVQYNGVIRTVGYQQTIAQSDDSTVILYANDLTAVS